MNHKKRFFFLGKKSIHTLLGFVMAAAVIIPGLSGCLRDGGPSFQDGDLWVRQTAAADNASGRNVMWQSRREMKGASLDYRKTDGGEVMHADAESSFYTGSGGKEPVSYWIYTVRLRELVPDTAYEYRIRSGEETGPWHPMKTDGGGSFEVLVYPDSQFTDPGVWKNTAQQGFKQHPEAAFFVNMGDLVDNGQNIGQWKSWMDGAEGIIDRIPAAPVMGNHETYSLDWKGRRPDDYLALFALPDEKENQGLYYSFDWGDAHFAVLNTQSEELKNVRPHLMEEQTEWLRRDLAQTHKKWKIVMMHRDVLVYGTTKNPDQEPGFSQWGKEWMPVFDEGGADLVLTAHLHTYRRRGHILNFQRSERGPLYIVSGLAGDSRYPDLWLPHPLDEMTAPQPETDNYMTLSFQDQDLVISSWLPDGTRIDEYTLHKS